MDIQTACNMLNGLCCCTAPNMAETLEADIVRELKLTPEKLIGYKLRLDPFDGYKVMQTTDEVVEMLTALQKAYNLGS